MTLSRSEEPREGHRHKQDKAWDLPGHSGLWTRKLSMAQPRPDNRGQNILGDASVPEPKGRQRLSILEQLGVRGGGGRRECLWNTLQGTQPALLPWLSLQPRHEARNSVKSEKHAPASPVSGTSGGRDAGGDARAEIPDLQGLTKAKQDGGVNNAHGKQAGNRG